MLNHISISNYTIVDTLEMAGVKFLNLLSDSSQGRVPVGSVDAGIR